MSLTEDLTNRIQDVIATSSKVRDGLHDDEALPLVEWGARYAEQISTRLADPAATPPDDEQVSNTAFTLTRLMTRINWVVTYRHKKDAAWLARTFQMINKLSQDLYGEDAPVIAEDEITTWIAEHPGRSNADLVQDLITRLTPAAMLAPSEENPAGAEPTLTEADALNGEEANDQE